MKIIRKIAFFLMLLSGVNLFRIMRASVTEGFSVTEAGAIGIIGGADGPTAIYTTNSLAPHVVAAIIFFLTPLAVWLLLRLCKKGKG